MNHYTLEFILLRGSNPELVRKIEREQIICIALVVIIGFAARIFTNL